MSETIAESLERAADLVGGKAWGAHKLRPRIYLTTRRRDANVFFEFPDASFAAATDPVDAVTCLGGARLRVHIDDCGQPERWYKGQVRKIMESYRDASLALSAFMSGEEDLAEAIMEADEIDDMRAFDAAACHIANGRFAEARQVLSAWLPATEA